MTKFKTRASNVDDGWAFVPSLTEFHVVEARREWRGWLKVRGWENLRQTTGCKTGPYNSFSN